MLPFREKVVSLQANIYSEFYNYLTLFSLLLYSMDRFRYFDVRVFDAFIEKFAERYVRQRYSVNMDVLKKAEMMDCGMDISALLRVIKSNSCYVDAVREEGRTPSQLKDIYRSDLGELLTTYYFEEKLPEGERYIIPLKNISTRERYDMPGRGLDAIGYRVEADGSYTLLLSETKVSEEKQNPPQVVHSTTDSIYKTQKLHHDNTPLVLQRLTDYVRKLSSGSDMAILGCIVLWMDNGETDRYKVTYGCGLVRDSKCGDKERDFGKMQSQSDEFRPGEIDFAIFSFTEKTISETVDMFYHRVMEIVK